MDNVCHTLVGAACAEAGLKTRTRFGMATLLVASNLPDLDVLVFATDIPAVAFRRGWTHGVLAQVLLPLALMGLLLALDRLKPPRDPAAPPARAGGLLLLSYVGVLSHVGLDFLNNYGIRLLKPFSDRWFYGDAVFIADPWLWLALGAGVWLARRRCRVRPARIALALATVYIAVMLLSARAARAWVIDEWVRVHGREPRALMVGPVFANPLAKQVIVDLGDRYRKGRFTWRPAGLHLEEDVVPSRADTPEARAARADPTVQAMLVWARFPFFELETYNWGSRVVVSDMRFGRFVAATVVDVD
ncbi:MAG: metal-dependent hydrolase [Acidimicrobiia bacterium]|nr:metal-dependent hydrolase [Acidimicrobiia bacterium]